tara:strand:+ start:147 stop:815 length:669 start_codon:yes stop_codon:yes gene_type:complete
MPYPKILLGRFSYAGRVESIWAFHIIVFAAVLFISFQPTKAQAMDRDSLEALKLYNTDGNCIEALPLLKKAEEKHGDVVVQNVLGQAYGSLYKEYDKTYKCILVEEKNDVKSFWYFSRAASNLHVLGSGFNWHLRAQNNVATAYANGYGVIKDITKAYMWVSICLKTSEAKSLSQTAEAIHCKKSLDILKRTFGLKPAFMAEAVRLADVCISSNFKQCGLPK